MTVPSFALKWALGEMAEELLLTNNRVIPEKLTKTEHPFQYPELEHALRHVLGRTIDD